MHSNKQKIALSLLLGMSCQVAWAQGTAGKALLEQGLYWQAQGNDDRAAEAWKKLLRLQPDEPRALYGLGQVEINQKRSAGAAEMLARLRTLDPKGVYTTLLAQNIALGMGGGPKALDKARLLHESRDYEKSVEQYQIALGKTDPNGDIGIEYYRAVGELPTGWKTARSGFERLAKASPNNPQIELNLAFLLARGEEPRWETRVDGIERLARLALIPSVSANATENWKLALGWLGVTKPEMLGLFDSYLKLHPDDSEVREMRAAGARKLQTQAKAAVPVQVNVQVAAGLKALSEGEVPVAESEYETRLKADPKDPDALGGLGLVRMRQNRWDESLTLLTQATQQKNGSSWNKALQSAKYQVLVEQAQRDSDPAKARSLLQQAIKLDPKQNGAVLALAALQSETGESSAAEKNYRQLLSRDGTDVAALSGLAGVLAATGKFEEAKNMIERLTPDQVGGVGEMNRLRASVSGGLAKAALGRGDVALAQATLEKAMSQDRDNPWIRWDLAQLYAQQGRNSEAQGLIDGLLVSQPDNAVALHASASLAAGRGQWRTALATLDRVPPQARTADMATLQKRSWLQHQAALAVSLARQGRKPEALALLEQAKPLTNGNRDLLGVLADGYVNAGAPNRGLGLLRELISHSPQPATADLLQYAGLLLKTEQDVESGGILKELSLKTLSPPERKRLDDLMFFHTLRQVDLRRERGDLPTARSLLAPMLAQRPNDPLANAVLARLTAAIGDKPRALELARQLAAKHPENVEIQLSAAQLATQFKDSELASTALKTAIALAPDDADVLSNAARLYRAQGKSAQAATLFERAIALQNAPAPGHDALLAATRAEAVDPDDLYSNRATPAWLQTAALDESPTAPVDYIRQNLSQAKPTTTRVVSTAFAGASTEPKRSATATTFLAVAATAPTTEMESATDKRAAPTLRNELDEIRRARSPEVEVGVYNRKRSGVPGSSQLNLTELPVELRFPVGDGKVKVQLNRVTLNAGSPTNPAGGSASPGGRADTQTASGVAGSIGYAADGVAIDAGQTPSGFLYKSFTGGIKLNGVIGGDDSLTYRVNLSRRPVTDSLLSFAGARDSTTGKTWGGVTATGGRLDITKDVGNYGFLGNAAWHQLRGQEVASNGRTEVGFGGYVKVLREADSQLTTGLNFNSMAYQKNLSDFSFGQGGYFSPQSYTAVTVPVRWAQRSGPVSYLLESVVGFQTFSQDTAATSGGSGPTAAPHSSSGVSYKLAASAQIKLAPQWQVDAIVQSDNTAGSSYRQWSAGLNLRYSFYPDSQPLPLSASPYTSPYGQ